MKKSLNVISSLFLNLSYGVRLFFLLLSSMVMVLPSSHAANSEIPSRNNVQNRLELLDKQKNLTPVDQLSQQDLIQTLEFLDAIEGIKQESNQLKQQLAQAPAKLHRAADDLDALNASDITLNREFFADLPLKQLETRLSQTLDELQSAQEDLANYSSQLVLLQTQPERMQSLMYKASWRIQLIRNQLNGLVTNKEALRLTQQYALFTEQAYLNAQLELQRKNLEANTTLQDLLQKQKDYTKAHIDHLGQYVHLLQEIISSKRLTLSETKANKVHASASEDLIDIQNDPLISNELAINLRLSQRLVNNTKEGNALVQQNIKIKNLLDRALQSELSLKEQIAVLKGSLLLSRILYQQQLDLPATTLIMDMDIATQIADLRLEQFDVNKKRDQLSQGGEYLQTKISNSKKEVTDTVKNELNQIINIRRTLLDELNKQLGHQLALAINLQINQQQLVSVNASLKHTLTQQIFWVSSNKPMDWTWWKMLPHAIQGEIGKMRLNFYRGDPLNGLLASLAFFVPGLIVIGIICWRYKLIDSYLEKLTRGVGQLKHDSQLHTPQAILLTLLKVLPGVLIILGIGYWCLCCDIEISDFLWILSQRLALLWLVFNLTYRMLSPNGITRRHFGIDAARCARYRRQVLRLAIALLPMIFWFTLSEKTPLLLVDDVMGQVVVLFALILLLIFIFPFCHESWYEKNSHAVRLIVVTAITMTPLILLGLMVAGYFYTTLQLAGRWINSIYLLFLWSLVYLTAIRGLDVAAHRLAYRRAVSRRLNLAKEGTEGSEPVDEPPLALERINQQSLRLTTMVLFLLFTTGFYWIWSDLITVISYFDSISLWHSNSNIAGSDVLNPVTLSNLLFAVLALIITYIMTRNLPGLLEVLVLSRLQLRQGTSYAITTTLTYLITVVGVVTVLSSLGVSWDKLQWLAAALSVGLGFGLQEIFANFVSGLIILFERPVRIGDTITIGAFSGDVSRIRIRATTITDFDRKEVIIPNKAFVTERLINWSLSDTVTRILIQVNVAYDSDLHMVKKILLQAAHDNPRVMADPEPQVFFMSFGTSALHHELRVYVRVLSDRSYTVDELNRRIHQLCNEHHIKVAFNQLEVYLHNTGQDVEVQEIKKSLIS